MIDLDDDRLATVLASVGEHLRVDAPLEAASRAPVGRERMRWALAVGAAAIVVLVFVLTVAPIRRTVADWLGIGSTRVIIIEPAPTTIPATVATTTSPSIAAPTTTFATIGDGLEPIDAAVAESLVGVSLAELSRSTLGPPAGVARMPEGGVLLAWPTGETLWIHASPMPAGVMFDKLVASSESVQRVDDLGDEALTVEGDHQLRTPHRTVDATTAVLWVSGDREFRLEGDHATDDLIAIARALDVPG